MNIHVSSNGPTWPVDPKFNPVSGFDPNGTPIPLSLDADGKLLVADNAAAAPGKAGAVYISDTTPVEGTFRMVQALENTVIASLISSDIEGTLEDIPLPAPTSIYGTITEITLTSGSVMAYKQ